MLQGQGLKKSESLKNKRLVSGVPSDNSTQAENVPEENNELTESQCEGVEEELEMSM